MENIDHSKNRVILPFMHDVSTFWDLSDFNIEDGNDTPNFNIQVMALIQASNIEVTVGKHAWSQVESSLEKIGFTDAEH